MQKQGKARHSKWLPLLTANLSFFSHQTLVSGSNPHLAVRSSSTASNCQIVNGIGLFHMPNETTLCCTRTLEKTYSVDMGSFLLRLAAVMEALSRKQ